jgi:hypothetical protein
VLAWPSLRSACGPQLLRQRPTVVRSGGPRPRSARSTLDGGMHARWRGDFTDAGGRLAMCSKRRCSTRMERRPRRRCLPARRQTGWRRGRGRRRAPAQLSVTLWLSDLRGGQRGENGGGKECGGSNRRLPTGTAVARGFGPETATRRSDKAARRTTASDRGCRAGAGGGRWLRTAAVG